jgi:hypothetical protein
MGIYLALRITLHEKSERTGHSVVLLRKQRIFLSLATIPAWTAFYAYKVTTYLQIQPPPPDMIGIPPLPVPFYIAGLVWLVIDVLWQFWKLQLETIRGPVIDGTPESFQNRWLAPINSSSPGNQNNNKQYFTKNKLCTCGGS